MLSQIILYEDGTPRTRHVSTNIEISIDESGSSAEVERYVTILQQTESLPLQMIASAQYHDKFTKNDGRWCFSQTVIRHPLSGDMSQHLKSEGFIEGG